MGLRIWMLGLREGRFLASGVKLHRAVQGLGFRVTGRD